MRLLRFVILTLVVIMVEFGISYLLSQKIKIPLIDAMFYIGVFFTILFIYFSSTGGLISNANEAKTATSYLGIKSNYKLQRTIGSLSVNFLNVGSALFLLFVFIIGFLY